MTKEERELSITYLEGIKEKYIEGEGYEIHPLPEYYAIELAIKALDQESVLDKIRAEIEKLQKMCDTNDLNLLSQHSAFGMALDIIDKYKAESEELGGMVE